MRHSSFLASFLVVVIVVLLTLPVAAALSLFQSSSHHGTSSILQRLRTQAAETSYPKVEDLPYVLRRARLIEVQGDLFVCLFVGSLTVHVDDQISSLSLSLSCCFCVCLTHNNNSVPPSKQIGYGEESRKYRRTIYTHADWEKHRAQDRFIHNLGTAMTSGIYKNIRRYVVTVTGLMTAICAWNKCAATSCWFLPPLVRSWQLTLPMAPFSLAMPSLGLLLVFRTNTAYARWDEARKNWGLNINHTRDLTRMATAFYDSAVKNEAASPSPTTQRQVHLKSVALGAWAYARAMKRHLSPDHADEVKFRSEVQQRLPAAQAAALIAAQHRPNRALQDLSAVIESLPLHFMRKDKLHASLTKFEDNLGSSERLLSSPVPLFYTRHTARFLAVWVLLLPFALYQAFGGHLATIPATAIISTCLFGIDELSTQLEEPFTILPMQCE